MQRVLDWVEKVGNKVPHPVVIFLALIAIVLVLAHILYLLGASVSYQVVNPDTHKIETATTAARSLLTVDGIRDMYGRLVSNFMGFTAVGLLIVAMVGAGVAEESGLVKSLIRKLVLVSPQGALTYILAFVGILSSVAADAGYVVLIPLAGAALYSVGRHPVAGIALGFGAVAGAFTVNMLIKPLDAVLTEITNDAIHMVDASRSIDLTANVWFSLASVPLLTVIIALITERVIEPRLGKFQGRPGEEVPAQEGAQLSTEESRGLRYSGLGLLAVILFFGLLTVPSWAPLRNPTTGALIGDSPFMNGLIGVIMVLFLATGIAYGIGAKTIKSSTDIISAMTKAVSGLGGTLVLFLVISQFIAYFNYSNIPTLMAVTMADGLKSANVGPLWLLLGFIVVVLILDLFFTPAIAKWAIFAPVFVPLFVQLSVDPAAVLAAYRIGDSPMNAITPLNAYFALVVGFAQKYDKNAGVGTVVALMLPYVIWISILWTLLFAIWYLLGLPWGL
ncbi:MAG: AbgT family transporter [Hyphomicrobiales bacterium]|nr:AbgT family transporter [Hyphomicrobiales bacterium]